MIPAKKKVGKAGPVVERPTLYVEKDPHKLVNYVCGSNIYNEGEDVKVNRLSVEDDDNKLKNLNFAL